MVMMAQIACVLAVLTVFLIAFIYFDSRLFEIDIWFLRQWRSERGVQRHSQSFLFDNARCGWNETA